MTPTPPSPANDKLRQEIQAVLHEGGYYEAAADRFVEGALLGLIDRERKKAVDEAVCRALKIAAIGEYGDDFGRQSPAFSIMGRVATEMALNPDPYTEYQPSIDVSTILPEA